MARIEQLARMNPLAFIVDGNLTEGDESNQDGQRIVTALRAARQEHEATFSIIAFPGNGSLSGADFQSPKSAGPGSLISALKSLL